MNLPQTEIEFRNALIEAVVRTANRASCLTTEERI